jgi:hypothetical protein
MVNASKNARLHGYTNFPAHMRRWPETKRKCPQTVAAPASVRAYKTYTVLIGGQKIADPAGTGASRQESRVLQKLAEDRIK